MACNHLKIFKSESGLHTYETINGFFVLNQNISSFHQIMVKCFDCETYNQNRLLACMHCVYFGCFVKHAQEHAACTSHCLFVELSNGQVYCHSCNDYTYDSDVEEISEKQKLIPIRYKNKEWQSNRTSNGLTRFSQWRPSPAETKVLQQHSTRVKVEPSTNVGKCGLVNLGSTCYMNSIMQAFLHTPVLRDYFFTDKHQCHARKTKDCLFCLFSRSFQKYYADEKTPVYLHDILALVWKNDPTIAGYEEKDAHEFLMSALNLLHQHTSTPTHNSHTQTNSSSIIELIFHGKMQSDVVCQACANVSTKIDPFADISLNIPDGPQSDVDLFQCLHHFTRAEVLESTDEKKMIRCSTCQSYQEPTKQLTFRLLPVIIIIHLKRFEHVNSRGKKKSLYVSFPMELDMSPYTSSLRNQIHLKKNLHNNIENRYTLYAVVVHIGSDLDNGHYVVYIRRTKHTWFRCTDDEVIPADTNEVMASEGYLLFYHKTILSYK